MTEVQVLFILFYNDFQDLMLHVEYLLNDNQLRPSFFYLQHTHGLLLKPTWTFRGERGTSGGRQTVLHSVSLGILEKIMYISLCSLYFWGEFVSFAK